MLIRGIVRERADYQYQKPPKRKLPQKPSAIESDELEVSQVSTGSEVLSLL
ncbi:MAG TPA: hypothetical protein PLF59_20890 [Cyclobacteriaceae bacterium]|nr:hypothetical protein [Cyclobacteriaceae bacterium]